MSEMRDRNFVPELVYRTKINYFTMRLNDTKKEKEIIDGPDCVEKEELLRKKEWYHKEIDKLKGEMNKRGFDVDNYYEVTLLLNSLIGLLVFPQQKFRGKIEERLNTVEDLPLLMKLVSKKGLFYSSYNEEKELACNILRHIKNSLSHERVMIIPQRLDRHETEVQNPITHIVFQDVDIKHQGTQDKQKQLTEYILVEGVNLELEDLPKEYEKGHSVFCLVVPVEELEDMIMEICDAILAKR